MRIRPYRWEGQIRANVDFEVDGKQYTETFEVRDDEGPDDFFRRITRELGDETRRFGEFLDYFGRTDG